MARRRRRKNDELNEGCLLILNKLFNRKKEIQYAGPTHDNPLPYGKRDHFLSAAEISFYHVLKGVLGDDIELLCKVRLGDLFYVQRPHENKGARNRIDRKHIDFVLCEAKTMNPILGIELDDSSHERQSRKERDKFVDDVFNKAGLKILHIKAARGYVPEDIAREVSEALQNVG